MSLEQSINQFWVLCRAALDDQIDFGELPSDLSELIKRYAEKKAKQKDVRIVAKVIGDKEAQKQNKAATEVLKLFDASVNGYRSATNVLLEFLKLQRGFDKGIYDLSVDQYIAIDGEPIHSDEEIENINRCPICNRFSQENKAFALISGGPQTDSGYQAYRNRQGNRDSLEVCRYCFTAGWVDLPTTKIVKDGQNIHKKRDYLFITTPLSKSRLERLLSLIIQHGNKSEQDLDETKKPVETDGEKEPVLDPLTLDLCNEFNVELSDPLSVLGLSTRRLRELRGFVLQSSNQLQRTIVLRVPIERIVGEDKISGAVRRELMKAVMYDFWQVTGGSLHYGRVRPDKQFSVDGQAVELDAMFRANCAYRIADRYARVGKYRHLNSSLFMLLLTHPRQAANRILNTKKREKKYAPGNKKIKEIIHMVEELVKEEDWQFQLGLKIIETLVDVGLLKKAKSFRYGKGPNDVFTGIELVKWIQRIKMVHDENSARAWGNMLINALKRGDLAYKDYVISQGGQISAPGQTAIQKIIDLVDGEDGIIQAAGRHNASLSELSREIANMDYYLLFYYNQSQTEEKEN